MRKVSSKSRRSKKITTDSKDDRTLLVYYNPEGKSWDWPKLPKGWHWIGGGTLVRGKAQYYRDDQFIGPSSNKEAVKKAIKKVLDKYNIKHKIEDKKLEK